MASSVPDEVRVGRERAEAFTEKQKTPRKPRRCFTSGCSNPAGVRALVLRVSWPARRNGTGELTGKTSIGPSKLPDRIPAGKFCSDCFDTLSTHNGAIPTTPEGCKQLIRRLRAAQETES